MAAALWSAAQVAQEREVAAAAAAAAASGDARQAKVDAFTFIRVGHSRFPRRSATPRGVTGGYAEREPLKGDRPLERAFLRPRSELCLGRPAATETVKDAPREREA